MADFIPSYKLCVYVPEEALAEFISAIQEDIPSFLGSYDCVCWWSEQGVEQSRKIGADNIQRVSCQRVEISMPNDMGAIKNFINSSILGNHPWDEPVITLVRQDIFRHD